MSTDPKDDVAAIVEADVKASGARTTREIREAIVTSFVSLTRPPTVQEISYDPEKKLMTVSVVGPKLPGP